MTTVERMYKSAEVVVFHKTRERWGELSNMAAGFPLVVVGVEWPTAEALYQACRFPNLADVQRLILSQSSPMAAKMKSKAYSSQTRPDWNVSRTQVMRWLLRVKLAQHYERFSGVLRRTGDRPIVEQSHKERFWGAIPDTEGQLRGANVLGRLLMEIRSEVQQRSREELLTVHPPALNHFYLLGVAVGVVTVHDKPTHPTRLF